MKKKLQSLISFSLALALVFMLLPTNTFAASDPTPNLLYLDSNSGVYVYNYQPAAYSLTNGSTTQLKNIFNADGDWDVPAFKRLTINYNLYDYSSVRLTILKMNGSTFEVVYNDIISGYGAGYPVSYMSSSPTKYKVLISGASSTPALLTSYIAYIN